MAAAMMSPLSTRPPSTVTPPPDDPHQIRDAAALQALFGPVAEPSRRKEVDHLHPVYQRWIAASPFVVLATSGPGGLDVSPRGDPAPAVRVLDAHTLLLPERRGNNRIDGLRNLLVDDRVALLFFIPGVGETLRVNGRAAITVDPALLRSFAMPALAAAEAASAMDGGNAGAGASGNEGHLPRCVLRIQVETVFFQCARALMRSSLWAPTAAMQQAAREVPTAGAILAALSGGAVGGEVYDRELPQRQRATLY
jgi:predicted pyridoxine 5'-phosphate oxidase superfamily flavin-nucleotide-binding protein